MVGVLRELLHLEHDLSAVAICLEIFAQPLRSHTIFFRDQSLHLVQNLLAIESLWYSYRFCDWLGSI